MPLIIGQATYGERNRGHRLLEASPGFPNGASLAGRMDVQGSPPPNTKWEPYLSGFAWNDHFIVARTEPDAKATRAGMAFSRAFAIPLREAATLDDIGGLFHLLAEAGDGRADISDLRIPPATPSTPGSTGLVQAMLADAPAPIVWPGQEGFDRAVASLWAALWPAARVAFSFRIAFSPTDVAVDPPTLVTTPTSLLSRWSSFRIVRPDAIGSPSDAAERYLLAPSASPSGLVQLIEALGTRLPRPADIRQLVKLDELITAGGSLADNIDALRRVCHLAPNPVTAPEIKRALVRAAVVSMTDADADSIRMARNLDLAAVPEPQAFWRALRAWAKERLWMVPNKAAATTVLEDALSGRPVPAWSEAVIGGFGQALLNPSEAFATALWQVLGAQPVLLSAWASRGQRAKRQIEQALLGQPPLKLPLAIADCLAAAAIQCDLPAVHAVCCAASLTPREAVRRHVADAAFGVKTLALAAREASGADRVAVALEHDDPLTLGLGAEAAAKTPSLLRALDVSQPRWRELWTAALDRDVRAATGPVQPRASLAALLDRLIDGDLSTLPLIEALSCTPLADLTGYARLGELWSRLSGSTRDRVLAATADAWLSALEAGQGSACDEKLAHEIVASGRLEPVLGRLVARVAEGCDLFRTLPSLDQGRFEAWLEAVLRRAAPLQPREAEALGRLIAARGWRGPAQRMADAVISDRREDLRPGIGFVGDLIGTFSRYLLEGFFSRTSVQAKWDILLEIALDLYGSGPAHEGLWHRAGGKERDIPKADTGAEAWRKVIIDAQRGKAAIDIPTLIRVMADDYRHNRMLEKLRWDSDFGVRR